MADMVKKVKVFLIKLYGKEGKMETRKKGSHLNIEERRQIAILDKEGWSPYKIAKKLKRASNTIRNELKRGTVKQVVGILIITDMLLELRVRIAVGMLLEIFLV